MKKLISRIIQSIKQWIRKRKQIATMICPSCGGHLVYRDCPGWGFWLGCTKCNKEF